jgi:hypothetical protein
MSLDPVTDFASAVHDVVTYARQHCPSPEAEAAIWNIPGIKDTWEIDVPMLRRVCESVRSKVSIGELFGPVPAEDRRIGATAERLVQVITAASDGSSGGKQKEK